jgi:DNA modification methylase
MLKKNTIYCGDNLDILKGMDDNSVDLCYIDPPFFTSKQYEVIWGDNAEKRAFDDRWVSMGDGRYTKDINVYLNFMEPRLREVHRVLKPTGSFYLHCAWQSDAYLRVLCDQIFDREPASVIIWKRNQSGKFNANSFAMNSDTILLYTKSSKYTFQKIFTERNESQMKPYQYAEEGTGRKFRLNKMYMPGNNPKSLVFPDRGKVIAPEGQRFAWNQKTLDDRLQENPGIIYWSKNDIPNAKSYLDEKLGVPVSNVWDDIYAISPSSSERLGYPTQKPEALLERIIKASSNEGDVILDAFCGCGTTLAVAKKLNRHFVGVDISPTACRLVAKRVSYPIGDIVGLPLESDEIAALTGYEFQNAVIHLLDPSGKTIKINNKGADGGIDGVYNGLLISVKKYKAGRKDLDEFVATLYRNKKTDGMFIALEYSSDFTKEIARLSREQEITIKHFTLAQLVKGEHVKAMPKEGFEALRPKETLDDLR